MPHPLFRRVRLETKEGVFVHDPLIPTFTPPPAVIMWGQRVFLWHVEDVYREAFAWVVVGEDRNEKAVGDQFPRLGR